MQNISVTLIGKPGCHLCDDAGVVVRSVLNDYPQVSFVTSDLSDNPEWHTIYADKIPVILVNDVEHAFWHVNEEDLRLALDTQVALSADANSE